MVFVSRDGSLGITNQSFALRERRLARAGRLEIVELRRYQRQFRFRQRFDACRRRQTIGNGSPQ